MIAIYTGLSRISDYRHHPTDVLTGFIQGGLTAYWVVGWKSPLLIISYLTLNRICFCLLCWLNNGLCLSFFVTQISCGVYKQGLTDSVCGLCMFPDMFRIFARRPSTSPPCLSHAPVQTCLPLACPWKVRCLANKLSVSRHLQSIRGAGDKRRWTAEGQGEHGEERASI